MAHDHQLAVLDESAFKVGDWLNGLKGVGVHWPFDQFTYEVTAIEPGQISLKIVPSDDEPQA